MSFMYIFVRFSYIQLPHLLIADMSDKHTAAATCAMTQSTLIAATHKSSVWYSWGLWSSPVTDRCAYTFTHTTFLNMKHIFILYVWYTENRH